MVIARRHVGSLERAQERREREAVAAERTRIARELHDVISHSVSLMVVQAGAGDLVFDSEPERAHDALRAVQSTGRQAIEDLGRLLRVLREPSAEPAVGPEPGLFVCGGGDRVAERERRRCECS